MSKILITSIGTGKKEKYGYIRTRYKIDDKIYEESFISIALHKHVKFDKIFMIGTKKSIWDSVYERFGGENIDAALELSEKIESGNISEKDLKIIEDLWEKTGLSGSKTFLINYGLNDNEIWDNFKIFLDIVNYIKSNDEIYLDITHSFRSLSLMSYIMLDFIKTIREKSFIVGAIYYGMFEYRYEESNKEKVAPVINLKTLFEINEWIKAINVLKNYGRADLITLIIQNMWENKRGNEKKIGEIFTDFSQNISIANLAAIKNSVHCIKNYRNIIEKFENPVLKIVLKELFNFVESMDVERLSDFQFKMAEWYFKNKNYALGYIALAESIVTKICECENLDLYDKEKREEAKNIFLRKNTEYPELRELYFRISKIRNNIAHQLFDRIESVSSDIEDSYKFVKEIKSIYHKLNCKKLNY